ncbi:hypothetical protein AAC387_Pa05g1105 [Persea americana]
MDNWRHLFLIGHCSVAVGLLQRGFLNNREESSMDEGRCIGKRTISFWLRNEWRTRDTSSSLGKAASLSGFSEEDF